MSCGPGVLLALVADVGIERSLVLPDVGIERLLVLPVCFTATVGAVVAAVLAASAHAGDVVVHGGVAR